MRLTEAIVVIFMGACIAALVGVFVMAFVISKAVTMAKNLLSGA